jgi:hypothetical protein
MIDTGALLVALAVGCGTVAVSPLGAVRWSVVLIGSAAGLFAGAALAAGEASGEPTVLVPAAVAFACAGMLFARAFPEPMFLLAVPLLVTALELAGGGVRSDDTDTIDRVLASSVFFLAAFATWAHRDDRLRARTTLAALALAPATAAVAGDLIDGFGTAPITAASLALLLPNVDRLSRG